MYAIHKGLNFGEAQENAGRVAHKEEGFTWYYTAPTANLNNKFEVVDYGNNVVKVADSNPYNGIGEKYPQCLKDEAASMMPA